MALWFDQLFAQHFSCPGVVLPSQKAEVPFSWDPTRAAPHPNFRSLCHPTEMGTRSQVFSSPNGGRLRGDRQADTPSQT